MKRHLACVTVAAMMAFPSDGFSATTYVLSFDPTDTRILNVSVTRSEDAAATRLVYHGATIGEGIKSQIQAAACDGNPLTPDPPRGAWIVPAGCKRVQWQVRFDPPGVGDASTQRSIASPDNSFRLFSEASSLATLADASEPQLLSVPKTADGLTIPVPRPDGTLVLPGSRQAPLFVLLGSKPAATLKSGNVLVSYFVDDAHQLDHVAPIQTELNGLRWLASLVPEASDVHFTYVWLGLSSGTASVGGATGSALLLVNYIRGGSSDSTGKAVMAAAPLMEATHQLAQSFGSRTRWAEESLTTYFGLKALGHALPEDKASVALLQRFRQDAKRFPLSLMEAQHHVEAGDAAAYATFFTKGVAFWAAVDDAIKATDAAGLDGKLKDIVKMTFSPDGQPPADFATVLGIPADTWKALEDRFLVPSAAKRKAVP